MTPLKILYADMLPSTWIYCIEFDLCVKTVCCKSYNSCWMSNTVSREILALTITNNR